MTEHHDNRVVSNLYVIQVKDEGPEQIELQYYQYNRAYILIVSYH